MYTKEEILSYKNFLSELKQDLLGLFKKKKILIKNIKLNINLKR